MAGSIDSREKIPYKTKHSKLKIRVHSKSSSPKRPFPFRYLFTCIRYTFRLQPDVLTDLLDCYLTPSKFQQKKKFLCSPKLKNSDTKHQSDSPIPAGQVRLDERTTAVTAALACEDACCGCCRLLAAASVSTLSFRRDSSCCRSDHDGLQMHRRRRAGVVELMGQWDRSPITIYVAAQYDVVILTPVLRLDGRTTAAAIFQY